MARPELEQPEERQQPEWLHKVREGFAQIVGTDNPTEMDLELMRRRHDVRRLHDPLRSAGRNKNPQHRRVDRDQSRKSIPRGDTHENMSDMLT